MKHNRELLDQISADILDGAMTVHRLMGPGLLESVYHHCLLLELTSRGLKTESMVPVKLRYKDAELNKTFYADMMVENSIILELKAVETVMPVHEAQVLSYLKLADKRLGFLINFNVVLIEKWLQTIRQQFLNLCIPLRSPPVAPRKGGRLSAFAVKTLPFPTKL